MAEAREPVVAFSDAALAFGRRTLWQGLDLAVAPGEFLAVLGPNGSGKTTLVRAILGVQPLSAGSLRVLGDVPRRGNPQIGYIPQQRLLDASTPIRGTDLIGFGIDGGRFGIPLPTRARRDRIRALTEQVGAGTFADRPAAQLSGGEQQRLRVGQALAADPRLLLCDEPLISLDLANQHAVAGLIDGHRHDRGAAVVFVTHDVNPILHLVDRVLYIVEGRFRIGTPDAVLRTEVLSELYGTHVDVVRVHDRLIVVGGATQPGDADGIDGHVQHDHAASGRAGGAR